MHLGQWIRTLTALCLMLIVGSAACVFVSPGTNSNQTHPSVQSSPDGEKTSLAENDEVEVFSWWTGGGEAAGLEAMIKVFNQKYPHIKFINAAVAGGAGTNAKAVLATRLQLNDPPDSFQGHAGQELIGTYVKTSQLEPLNFLYDQNGWLDVMPKTLIPLISDQGKIYSVPVNIHRANVLWYNPKLLRAHQIAVPQTWSWEEFFSTAEKLKSEHITPLALGEQWTAMHLMEVVLLGQLGAEKYSGLWTGSTDWNGPEVTQAIVTFKKVLTFTNDGSAALSWQDAARMVEMGKAAFTVMGDWVDSLYKEDGLIAGQDYGWSSAPATEGFYQFLSDSFVLPRGAKHREAALAWLTIAGSKEGQDAFNPVKGSIPARSDINLKLYGAYLQFAIDDWKSDIIVGSLTHGVVANDNWKNAINEALGKFLIGKDASVFQSDLAEACVKVGACAH